jgi:phage baseplate assembly protein gpV
MKGNSFSNTTGGCALYFLGADNTIYHNNFYNSSGIVTYDNINRWDNGAEGNYWADYAGEDLNGDGIGDTFVPHRGVDRYPLMDPWNSVRIFTVMINQSTYNVTTFSESTIASFSLNQSEKTLGFNITSADTGFCNVTIPRAVLNDTLTVFIDGAQTDSIFKQNATHSLVWFAHEHGTHSVKIKSISVIPSELSVSVGASTLYIGFKVNVYGRLTYANGTGISNARILLSYSVTGGDSWADITSVTTGASGNFSVQWIPSATGMYIVRAIYAGNQTYSTHILATTVLVNLAVLPFEEQYVFSVSSNSTVSAFSFNSTTRELRFTVNGESGTDGYVDMTISKSLVQNITDLKIYLNGTEISYVTSSTDDSWLIHFSYHHSTHSVLVSLGSLQGVQVFPWWLLALLAVVLGIFALAIVVFKRKSLRSTRSSSALSAR